MNDCYVGAATGCLKALSLSDHTFLNLNSLKDLDPKRDEITRMVFGNNDQNQLIFSTANREVRSFDTTNCQTSKMFDVPNGSDRINGLYLTPNDQLVVADRSGHVSLLNRKGQELNSFKGGQGLLCLHGDGDRIAVGGKDCPAKVFSLEKSDAPTWISKNVANDNLGLNVSIWDTDVRLLPDSETLITGTGTHMIRMYDMRAQRRPVRQAEWMESPVTALSLSYRDHQIFAGNTIGEFGLFDLRGKTRIMLVCKFKGQAGSIRSIYGHPTAPYVASCGIDRFTRVHDINSRKLVSKIYCKTRLNCVLLRDDLSILKAIKKEKEEIDGEWDQVKGEKEDGSNSESDGEGSDVWDEMEEESGSDQGEDEPSDDDSDDDSETSDSGDSDQSEEEPSPPEKKRRVTAGAKKSTQPEEIKEEATSGDDDDDDEIKIISTKKFSQNLPSQKSKAMKKKQGKGK